MSGAVELVEQLSRRFSEHADPQRAPGMAAYMKDVAPFHGIAAEPRRALQREVFRAAGPLGEATVVAVVRACWERPEREFQYAGAELLAERLAVCSAGPTLEFCETLITTKPWWDTVDVLCRHVAGALVRREPARRVVIDRWLASDDIWLIRSALLHQERWGAAMDFGWQREASLRRAGHREFFVRKAIGWALRTYAHRGPAEADAVRALLAEGDFSGLTRREALLRVRH